MRMNTQEATLPRYLLAAGGYAYIASFPSRAGPARGGRSHGQAAANPAEAAS